MKIRVSWRTKLADSKGLPRVEPITGKMSTRWGTGTVVIPAPIEVDEIMRRIPEGKLITVVEIRAALAKKHGSQRLRLEAEGHKVVAKGKRFFVQDYGSKLARI